jgi:hypothetical protein
MEKWKKIIVHNEIIGCRYDKTTKVFFYKKSNLSGFYTYFPNKLIKDYQSGDYYKQISVCRDFQYKAYAKNKEPFVVGFDELVESFNKSNLKIIERDINSNYLIIKKAEIFIVKNIEVIDELINL